MEYKIVDTLNVLSFLGLEDTYSEKDSENAILAELQIFILETGSDFASIGQYDGTNYYLTFDKGPLPKVWAATRLKRQVVRRVEDL